MKTEYYPCYFCQSPILGNVGQIHWRCQPCTQEYQLYQVLTTLDNGDINSKPLYAHIFTTENIQVRLHLKTNLTYIENAFLYGNEHNYIVKMEGFPITLSNAKHKVKLYITFS
jgi:hypothetical protein